MVGRLAGDVDERGVGQHPAHGGVAVTGDGVAGVPELADDADGPPRPQRVDARGAAPRVDPLRGGPGEQRRELLAGPLGLALLREVDAHEVAQLAEHLDVERRVAQPRVGQRPGRPVDGRVLLGEREPEVVLDDGGQADAVQPEEAGGELGVEELPGPQADLGEAGEVLRRGVQDPLGGADGVLERREVGDGDGVDEPGARALAPHLDQVGPLAVAVAGGALGVDRRPGRLPAATAAAASSRPRSVSTTAGHALGGLVEREVGARSVSVLAVGGGVGRRAHAAGHRRGPGRATTPSGSGGRPGDRAEEVGPREEVVADVGPEGGPRRAHLHLDARRAVGQAGEALADDARHGAGLGGRSARRGPRARRRARSSRPRRAGGRRPAPARARRARRSPPATRRPTARGPTGRGGGRTDRRRARRRPAEPRTSAVSATAYGAMRWGAGTSVIRISGRSRTCVQGLERLRRTPGTRGREGSGCHRMRVCREAGSSAGRPRRGDGRTPSASSGAALRRALPPRARVVGGVGDLGLLRRPRREAAARPSPSSVWTQGLALRPALGVVLVARRARRPTGSGGPGWGGRSLAGLRGRAGWSRSTPRCQRDDGRRRADRLDGRRRPRRPRCRVGGDDRRPWVWVGIVVAVVGIVLASGPELSGAVSPRPVLLACVGRPCVRCHGAVLPRPWLHASLLLMTLWGCGSPR